MTLTLKNLDYYTPEYADLMYPGFYLQTEDGLDWYYHRVRFKEDTLKICFDHKGVIRMFDHNAQILWPVELSVTEVDTSSVPEGLNNHGDWMWDGTKIIPLQYTEQENKERVEARRKKLLADAAVKIAPLQDALDLGVATDKETAQLLAWKIYRVQLIRMTFTGGEEMIWPSPPET